MRAAARASPAGMPTPAPTLTPRLLGDEVGDSEGVPLAATFDVGVGCPELLGWIVALPVLGDEEAEGVVDDDEDADADDFVVVDPEVCDETVVEKGKGAVPTTVTTVP